MSDFKWRHFHGEVIVWVVRWYCVNYRDLEQMMSQRVCQSIIPRFIVGFRDMFRRLKSGCDGTGVGPQSTS
ncbi:transposase-like protein [Rhizobium giardinii]|uniref:Transposase-like protein n=1 Tax=Rhizobium giardinii TaxID=56731 RepID=A0A7W8X8L7_9HYPH|nr:transposase-like protein [Rhizobium giardinii]